MKVNYEQMLQVNLLTEAAGQNGIKKLAQWDRKKVYAMMTAMAKGQKSVEIAGHPKLLDLLLVQLKQEPKTVRSNFFVRFLKGIGNRLSLRRSSAEVFKAVTQASASAPKSIQNVKEFKKISKQTVESVGQKTHAYLKKSHTPQEEAQFRKDIVAELNQTEKKANPIEREIKRFLNEKENDPALSKLFVDYRKAQNDLENAFSNIPSTIQGFEQRSNAFLTKGMVVIDKMMDIVVKIESMK